MEWYYFALVIILIVSLHGKLESISKKLDNLTYDKTSSNRDKDSLKDNLLDDYIGKKVILEIDNDTLDYSYLFSTLNNTQGEILEYDDEWLVFRYYHKQKKKTVEQYFRRRDITSINEVNDK